MDVIEPGSSGRAETDALIQGPKWTGNTITFSFPTLAGYADYGGTGEVADNFAAFTAAQQAAVRSILAEISNFSGLTFVEVSGAQAGDAVLRFASSGQQQLAHAYGPSVDAKGGDVWLSSTSDVMAAPPVPGNYPWFVLMHEIGHALGLVHLEEPVAAGGVTIDWLAQTVMSPDPVAIESGIYGEIVDLPHSFMIEDIAALQFLYGANFDSNVGDTVYRWDLATGEFLINGVRQGAVAGHAVFQTIWDSGGVDTYDLSTGDNSAGIDLNPGGWSHFSVDWRPYPSGGMVGNALQFQGDNRSLIENAIGTRFDDMIVGNTADNHIVGGAGDDTVYGGAGRDLLEGGDGSDRLYGDEGEDRLYGGEGADVLRGGMGNDDIYGEDGNDGISGEDGNDRLFGGSGNDGLDAGDGDDYLDGGEGDDTLFGGAGDDTVLGLLGSNVLLGGEGNDILTAGAGNDRLDGGPGADLMTGGDGDDFYVVDDPDDVVVEGVGGGYDWLQTPFTTTLPAELEAMELTGYGLVNATGNDANNWLRGTPGNNIIDGRGGADYMEGGNGDDVFYVDDPNDQVIEYDVVGFDTVYSTVSFVLANSPPPPDDPYSGASQHPPVKYAVEMLVLTGAGDLNGTGSEIGNILVGNSGQNILDGRDGDDTLIGHRGEDALFGGPGIDTASYAGDEGGVFVNLTLGRGYGNASFGDTYDSIENVIGTDYNDFIIGDPGTNRLDGAGGDDTIIGAVGPDEIIGGTGLDWASYEDNSGTVFVNLTLRQGFNNAAHGDTYDGIENLIGGLMDDFFIGDEQANRLNGAMGADTLLGAGGADIFMFTYAPGATSTWGNPNVDLILDFTTGVDKIELSAGAFPGLAAGALPAAAFYAGTAAHDGDDRIIYDAASGKLWFDPDGNGAQAAMLFATLGETSHPAAIAAGDFVVV